MANQDSEFYKNMIANGAELGLIEKLIAAGIDNVEFIEQIEPKDMVLLGLNLCEMLNLKAVIKKLSDKGRIVDPEEVSAVNKMEKHVEKMKRRIDLINDTTKEIENQSGAQCKRIKETFDRIRARLKERESELMDKVHQIATEKKLKLTQIAKDLRTQCAAARRKIGISKKMMKEPIEMNAASMKKRKEKILKLLKQVKNVKVVQKTDSMITNKTINVHLDEKKVFEFVSKFGVVSSSLVQQHATNIAMNDDYKMPENGLNGSVFMKDNNVKKLMMENILAQTLKNKKFELLLRKSVHGKKDKAFYDRCYDKGSILIIAESKENKKRIFGAYTKVGFKKGINNYQNDADAFLYAIDPDKAQRFKVKVPQYAIYSQDIDNSGVSFGWDMCLYNNGKGTCDPNYYDYTSANMKLPLHGGSKRKFTIKDYEVWRLI